VCLASYVALPHTEWICKADSNEDGDHNRNALTYENISLTWVVSVRKKSMAQSNIDNARKKVLFAGDFKIIFAIGHRFSSINQLLRLHKMIGTRSQCRWLRHPSYINNNNNNNDNTNINNNTGHIIAIDFLSEFGYELELTPGACATNVLFSSSSSALPLTFWNTSLLMAHFLIAPCWTSGRSKLVLL